MRQFVKTYTDMFAKGLKPNEVLVYSFIADRMKSSMKDARFYDKKQSASFVIFPNAELAKVINVSERTVRNAIAKLVEIGLVVSKRQFNRPNKIFLPDYELEEVSTENVPAKSSTPVRQNVPINQKTKIIKQNTNNTVNTEKREKNKSFVVNQEECWVNSVTEKGMLPRPAANVILRFVNHDLNKAHDIVGIINKAKYRIAKENHLLNRPESRFEHNTSLSGKIGDKLNHIFSYLQNRANYAGYLFNALKTFFRDAMGIENDEQTSTTCSTNKQLINNQVPEWMHENYDRESNRLTPDMKKKNELALEKLRKLRANYSC